MADHTDVKVMIVEDNLSMRTIISTVLRSLGFSNQGFAEDGHVAFRLIPEYAPDLIVTDIKMPNGDGLDFIRAVRNKFPEPFNSTPILVITAHATERDVRESLASGIDQFLTKPLAPKSLAQRLNVLIEEERDFVREGDFFGPRRNAPSTAQSKP